jgi:hypothetical protein
MRNRNAFAASSDTLDQPRDAASMLEVIGNASHNLCKSVTVLRPRSVSETSSGNLQVWLINFDD